MEWLAVLKPRRLQILIAAKRWWNNQGLTIVLQNNRYPRLALLQPVCSQEILILSGLSSCFSVKYLPDWPKLYNSAKPVGENREPEISQFESKVPLLSSVFDKTSTLIAAKTWDFPGTDPGPNAISRFCIPLQGAAAVAVQESIYNFSGDVRCFALLRSTRPLLSAANCVQCGIA